MVGHICNKGYIIDYHCCGTSAYRYATIFKGDTIIQINISYIKILPIEEQIKEFNEHYFKFIPPPEHLKNFVKTSPIEDEAKK